MARSHVCQRTVPIPSQRAAFRLRGGSFRRPRVCDGRPRFSSKRNVFEGEGALDAHTATCAGELGRGAFYDPHAEDLDINALLCVYVYNGRQGHPTLPNIHLVARTCYMKASSAHTKRKSLAKDVPVRFAFDKALGGRGGLRGKCLEVCSVGARSAAVRQRRRFASVQDRQHCPNGAPWRYSSTHEPEPSHYGALFLWEFMDAMANGGDFEDVTFYLTQDADRGMSTLLWV